MGRQKNILTLFDLTKTVFLYDLSQGAWIAIALIVILIISTNLGLWAAFTWRKQDRDGRWIRKLSQTFLSPWEKENKQLQELSEKVKELSRKGKGNNEN